MKTFLFQGDSVTDCGRNRDKNDDLGMGYPTLIQSEYMAHMPNEFEFINRACSGDRIVDVYARIKVDIINLQPDYLSILIGVNDVWHEIQELNGVQANKYEMIYSMLIEEVTEALPGIQIFILEPFVLEGTATGSSWGYFKEEVLLRAEAAKRVAEKYRLHFVPLQSRLDKAATLTKTGYWLKDGVHPTAAGHQIIRDALVEAFEAVRS